MKIEELFWLPEEEIDEIVRALYETDCSPLGLQQALFEYGSKNGYSVLESRSKIEKKLPEGQQIEGCIISAGTKILFSIHPPTVVLRDKRNGTVDSVNIFLRGRSGAIEGVIIQLNFNSKRSVQKNFKRNGKRDWLKDFGIL